MLRATLVGACLVYALIPGSVHADEDSPNAAVDRLVHRAAAKVIKEGVALYNAGDQQGCYRVFQGGLIGLSAMVGHRPETERKITDALSMAASKTDPGQASFALRDALNEVYLATGAVRDPSKLLWERLGGQSGVEAVVRDFVSLASQDSDVDFLRGGQFKLDDEGVAHLEKALVEMISSVTGGPLKYEGQSMKQAHAGMAITDAQFDALAADLVAVLRKYKIEENDIAELIAIVGSTRAEIVENQPAAEEAAPPPEEAAPPPQF